jgi:hypothetical protein
MEYPLASRSRRTGDKNGDRRLMPAASSLSGDYSALLKTVGAWPEKPQLIWLQFAPIVQL